jgi:hypothetical protein
MDGDRRFVLLILTLLLSLTTSACIGTDAALDVPQSPGSIAPDVQTAKPVQSDTQPAARAESQPSPSAAESQPTPHTPPQPAGA